MYILVVLDFLSSSLVVFRVGVFSSRYPTGFFWWGGASIGSWVWGVVVVFDLWCVVARMWLGFVDW